MAGESQKQAGRSHALSPLQEGMLFHTLSARQPGVDIEQVVAQLSEELDARAFRAAWESLIERHAVLRTAFRWDGPEGPRQEVHRTATLPFAQLDWRASSWSRQTQELARLLAAERRRGFDLAAPPLMRVVLIRRGAANHQFVWTFHHLLLDGHAIGLVLSDLFAIYEAIRRNEAPALSAPPPYHDHLDWLQRQDWPAGEAFWRKQLTGFSVPTELPVRGPGAEAAGETLSGQQQTQLSPEVTAALRTLAQKDGLTLNTLLQGAWALLLCRYSGARDVVFGAVRAGRHSTVAGAEAMVGLLINTVPVRIQCPLDRAVLDWLKTVRAQWVAMREWEQTPLVRIQSWSEVPPGAALFETVLSFQDPSWDAALHTRGGPWRKRRFRIYSQPNYPLALDASGGTRLLLKLIYDRSRFDEASIGRMLGHLKRLLERLPAHLHQPLSQLSFLSDPERHQLLAGWNQTRSPIPDRICVQHLFERQVGRTPGASALATDGRQLTYLELNQRANRLAHHLRELGVGPDVPVGVLAGRSPEMVVGLLAILKAGGAYVPLDPDAPPDRLAFMLRDTAAPVVLLEEKVVATLPAVSARLIRLDRPLPDHVWARPDAEANLPPTTTPENLAYIIYTSGSTGTPKGVEIRHLGLVNLIQWHQQTYRVTPDDRATQLAGLSFDAAVWELWPYLTAGASIHFPDEETRLTPRKLLHWLAAREITLSFVPTPLAEAMMEEPWPENLALRALLTGGDTLHRWPRADLPCGLINHYGPTENTVVTTFAPLEPGHADGTAPPIGRPIANVEVYVLDPDLEPAPVGVPGELLVGGPGLARGYLNRPELTAEKFIAHPFSTEPGARLYRTGDRVRWLPDGNLEFLGRFDSQVKVRGHRIELGEIESVLARHPSIRQCVALLREDEPGAKQLVAYFVPAPDAPPEAQELRRHLQANLPEVMVPAAFIALPALPLTPNGKVDRRALPRPDTEPAAADAAPRTATEDVIAKVWSAVLKRRHIGRHDNFFDLGGHSLLATQVVSRLTRALSVELPLRDLFDFPTVGQLAERIDSARPIARPAPLPAAVSPDSEAEHPLSFAQQRLWFLEQLHPGTPLHNVPVAIRLDGQFNLEALECSLNEIIRRHGALRTAYRESHGQPVARTDAVRSIHVPVVDLTPLPEESRIVEARRRAEAEAGTAFDLGRSPLLRAVVLRLRADEHHLILTLHHLISDGWSLGILYRELTGLYGAFLEGRILPLKPPTASYQEFAGWQRRWFQSADQERQLAYWKQQLGGALPVLELPGDRPRPPVRSYRGATVRFALPAGLTDGLAVLSRREAATPFMVLLAAYGVLLHRYTGQEDILIGSPVAGRAREESEDLIGLFLNMLALRVDVSGNPPFLSLLQRVRRVALEAYAHQDLPVEKLVEVLQPDRDLSRTPLFQTLFVLQDAPLRPLTVAGLRLTPMPLESGTAKFDLTLSLEQGDGGLSGCVEYSRDLFDEATIHRLIGHYRTLLEGILAEPSQPVSQLPLLTIAEQHQVLTGWNATERAFPRDKCIHQLFEEQVARTPDAVAVACNHQALTYRELNERADQLAGHLRTRGVGPDVPVGVLLKRSLDLIPSLLGILKAGGAYLPLDPAYPAERLTLMLEDSRAPVLLTQRELADRLPRGATGIICVDAPTPVERGWRRSGQRDVPVSPEQLAYLIYTSGSTGKPKGVMVAHRNVVNFFTGMDAVIGPGPGVWLAVTSICFDISVLEIFWTLTRGFSVVLHTGEEPTGQGPSVLGAIRRHGVSHLQCTPSLARTLILAPESREALRSLKALMLGGEALPLSLAEQLRGLLAGDLLNLYGPTETTVWSTTHRVTETNGLVPIGRPIANTQIHLLDPHGQPVPVGVPGELHIGGEGVARGYWERPGLTREKFIPNPFAPTPGARLYRTGDLARYRADGALEFLGRLDHQVKIRGHRIELGEIEAVMGRHPTVAQCVVVAREDTPGNPRLVAYLVTRQSPPPVPDELRRYAREKLPEVMVPAVFVLSDELPLTPNGKVDRKALPPPETRRPTMDTAFSPAQTEMENTIAGIWQAVLQLDAVGLHDNFFDLGGHSLLVVQVQARLRERLGLQVPILTLFEHPTVHALAKFLSWIREPAAPLRNVQDRARRQRHAIQQQHRQPERATA